MKLLLTRLGQNSKVILCGDASQSDLDERVGSGFNLAQRILNTVDGIGFMTMTEKDIVRHKLVKDIILSYAKYETRTFRRDGVMSNNKWDDADSEDGSDYLDEDQEDPEEFICTNVMPITNDADEYEDYEIDPADS